MRPTTLQRFGSLGKSFVSPSAAAAVIGAALLASDTSDTSETAWSPAAACLLPDVLPVAGTLLSYGGNRQLAAGGTVSHSGRLGVNVSPVSPLHVKESANNYTGGLTLENTIGQYSYLWNGTGGLALDSGPSLSAIYLQTLSTTRAVFSSSGLNVTGAITASGNISATGTINGSAILCDGSTVFDTSGYRLDCGVSGGFNTLTVPVLLQLGGTTSSFPAIKRSGTTTAFRLADDSADGPITCGAITASGQINLADGSISSPTLVWGNGRGFYKNGSLGTSHIGGLDLFHNGDRAVYMAWDGISVRSDAAIGFSSTTNSQQGGGGDAYFVRNSASSIGLKGSGGIDAAMTCGAITASGNITTAGDLVLASGSTGIRLVYNSSGVGTIYNYAGTDFGRLNIGGTTSSFPAIKRSGTTTAFRLADDSADGPISCGAITASGNIGNNTVGSAFQTGSNSGVLTSELSGGRYNCIIHGYHDLKLSTGNGGYVYRNSVVISGVDHSATFAGAITASGQIVALNVRCQDGNGIVGTRYINNSNDTWSAFEFPASVLGAVFSPGVAGILRFEGSTSSFPAIKRSGTTTAFRLADDSADGPISCAGITASPDSGYPNAKVLVVNPNIDSSLFPGSTVGAALAFTHYGSGDRRGGIGVNNSGHFVVGSFANNVYNEIKFAGSATTYRTGTHIFRNAADSADGTLTCGAITASGAVTINSGTTADIWLAANASIGRNNNDVIVLRSSTDNSFTVDHYIPRISVPSNYYIAWSNTSSNATAATDTALSRNAAGVVEINNGTAGTYRDLLVRNITASGAIQETPTQSALDPTTTNIPSGKRQGWYNSTLAEFRDWVNIGGTLLKSAAYT